MPGYYRTTGIVVLCSLLSVWLAETLLVDRIPIIAEFIGLQLSHNPGVAFGIGLPEGIKELLIFFALFFVHVMFLESMRTDMQQLGFGLIVGGGIANIIDRLFDGFVTDYIQVGSFPIFNLADSCVTVGVVVLLGEAIWNYYKKPH